MGKTKASKLPQECIVEILTRLPAKSVGKFRCVSKLWCSLLSDSKFIKTHLTIHAHKQPKLICVSRSHTLHTLTFNPKNGNDGISRNLKFRKLSPKSWLCAMGSCNGLALVNNQEKIQFLINPITLKYHKIPEITTLPPGFNYRVTGVGYDVVNDDYKVVTLSRYNIYEMLGNNIYYTHMYSVRKGLWRRVEGSLFDRLDLVMDSGVFVRKALHWAGCKTTSDGSYVIVAYDLSDETFLEVPLPPAIAKARLTRYNMGNLHYNIGDFKGCFCMFADTGVDKVDVWIMKEYGVQESWTKFTVTRPASSRESVPLLCLVSDDDVVLDAFKEERLIVSNTKEHKWRDMKVDGKPAKFKSIAAFTESLVSPVLRN